MWGVLTGAAVAWTSHKPTASSSSSSSSMRRLRKSPSLVSPLHLPSRGKTHSLLACMGAPQGHTGFNASQARARTLHASQAEQFMSTSAAVAAVGASSPSASSCTSGCRPPLVRMAIRPSWWTAIEDSAWHAAMHSSLLLHSGREHGGGERKAAAVHQTLPCVGHLPKKNSPPVCVRTHGHRGCNRTAPVHFA